MSRTSIDEAMLMLAKQVELQMSNDISCDDIPIVRKMIQSVNTECYCDDYVGFDCGCGFRRMIVAEALKEIEEIEKEETK